jgi:oligopeptide transport system permease protein
LRDSGISFLVKKIIELVTSLAVLATFLFLLLKLLPGGPFDAERNLDPAVLESLNQSWGLHDSFLSQAFHYFISLLQGDLGVSMIRPQQTVFAVIQQGIANTLALNLIALVFVVVGSVGTALMIMRYRGGFFESLMDQILIIFVSLPSLFWGPFLIYIFAFYFDLLPVALLESPAAYVLPVITLSLRPFAILVRLLKTSLSDNIRQDYTRTAIAKGLSPWAVLVKHVLRNSSVAFLSYLGPLIVSLISGSFLVELLFAVPGLGTEFVSAINDRDYTVIAGITLFYGSLLLILNTIIDIGLKKIDPRLQEEVL